MAKRDERKDRPRKSPPAADEPEIDDLYSAEYLAEVAGGNARAERLEEL